MIQVKKSALSQQLTIIKIVHRSSMMMKLLNEAMLNSTLIKQGKYHPCFSTVKEPFKIIRQFINLFDSNMKQKNLKLEMEDTIYGNIQGVEAVKNQGILIDVKLYEQILYHIFLNACKFNKEEGIIKVTF